MKEKVICAVIGSGRLGLVHANNLVQNIPDAEVKYIVTSRQETAKKAAEELGIANWTNKIEDVLEDESIDAVIIGTPTNTHAELILKAAQYKKHVFVDKPITRTADEADAVITSVKENQIICQVGFMRRFDPGYADAKRSIERGDIGQPIHYRGISRDPGSPPESFIKTSGGIFIDLCIHEYDMARYLIASEVTSIQTHGEVLVHPFMKKYGDVDQSLSYLRFESGATADIEGSRNSSYGYDIRGEVIGTEGMIQIGSMQQDDNIIFSKGRSYYQNIPSFPSYFQEAFVKELEHFILCVKENKQPLINERDGKIALQIAEAAQQSFEEDKKIIIQY